MKLLRIGERGREKPALLDAKGRVCDLSGHVDDIAGNTLSPQILDRLAGLDTDRLREVVPDRIGPCVGNVGKFIGIGLNYADHAAESGLPIPSEPIIFMKAVTAISGPNDPVVIPLHSVKTDWEVELGVVIGSSAKYVSETDALSYVAGYCTINDVSEREFQAERGGTWDKGKGCDTFGPIGPWLVTRDEVPDPQTLKLWLDIDGERVQDGSTATMIFSVAHIVSYVSHFMRLEPGDVIATGTPPGVGMGMKPQRFLKPGETMRLSVEGLGVQEQRVEAEAG